MLQEPMEKLTTALAAYEPNPAWTVDLFYYFIGCYHIRFYIK
jgi:transposase InsO family protein